MDWWQAVDRDHVLAGDWELLVKIVEQTAAQEARVDAKIVSSEAAFDGDFPEACRAEYELVLRVVEQGASSGRQSLGLSGRPQEDVSVQQELHARSKRCSTSADPM